MKNIIYILLAFCIFSSCREEIIQPEIKNHPAILDIEWSLKHADEFSKDAEIVGLATDDNLLIALHNYAYYGNEAPLSILHKNGEFTEPIVEPSFQGNAFINAPHFIDIMYHQDIFHIVGAAHYEFNNFEEGKYHLKYDATTNTLSGQSHYTTHSNDYFHNIFAINDFLYALRVEEYGDIVYETLETGSQNTTLSGTATNTARVRTFGENFYNISVTGKLKFKYNSQNWSFLNATTDDIIVDVVEYEGQILVLGEFTDSDDFIKVLDPNTMTLSPYFSEQPEYIKGYGENINNNLGNSKLSTPQFKVLNGKLFLFGLLYTNLTSEYFNLEGLIMELKDNEASVLFVGDDIRDMEYFNGRYYAAISSGLTLASCELPD